MSDVSMQEDSKHNLTTLATSCRKRQESAKETGNGQLNNAVHATCFTVHAGNFLAHKGILIADSRGCP